MGSAAALSADLGFRNPTEPVPVLGRQANDQRESTLAFQNDGRLGARERGLYDTVDVAGVEAVARRLWAVHRDVEVRLPQDAEDAEIAHPLHLVRDGEDL